MQLAPAIYSTQQEFLPLLTLKVKKVNKNAVIPRKAMPTEAGIDLFACFERKTEKRTFHSWPAIVNTGIAFEIPTGYYGQIKDRSSMAIMGFIVSGGVIDCSFRGEVSVILTHLHGAYTICHGDKIAQMIILPVPSTQIIEVNRLSQTLRGKKKFGSSGK